MQFIKTIISISAAFYLTQAYALSSDYQKPVNVVSKEQEFNLKTNIITFKGDVKATQGSIRINADHIEIKRDSKGQLEFVSAFGNPVKFYQKLDDGKELESSSQILSYNPKSNNIRLTGNARISQGESNMEGEIIEYNIQTQTMKAKNGNTKNSRVSSTFVPQELKD